MQHHPKSQARQPTRHSRMGARLRRHARLLYGIAAVFVAGVVVGAMLGGWVARDDAPGADVAIDRIRPALQVPVRAYRPPVRVTEPRQPIPETHEQPIPETHEQPIPETLEQHPEPQQLHPADTAAATPDTEIAETAPEPPAEVAPELPAKQPAEFPVAAAPADPIAPVSRLDTSGTATWLANAAASPATEGRPMIAIVIDDLGLDQTRTKQVIALPAPLTLAFIPYGYNLRALAKSGREAGHELIVHVNMEPTDRGVDPGPKALLTSLSQTEIRERVIWALGRFDGYVGINNHMGSRFTEWPEGMETVLQILRVRGLLFLDSLTSTSSVGAPLARAYGMAYAARDVFLDHDQSAQSVIARLKETERVARKNGSAIAIGHPHDVTVDALRSWIPEARAAGFQLVPLTAIVRSRRGEG